VKGGHERATTAHWNPLREPALIVGFLAMAAQLVPPMVTALSPDRAGVINAAVVAVAGAVTAWLVHSAKLAPAVLGAASALLALGLALGLHLDAGAQAEIMAGVAAAVAAYVRTQVTAQPPVGGVLRE